MTTRREMLARLTAVAAAGSAAATDEAAGLEETRPNDRRLWALHARWRELAARERALLARIVEVESALSVAAGHDAGERAARLSELEGEIERVVYARFAIEKAMAGIVPDTPRGALPLIRAVQYNEETEGERLERPDCRDMAMNVLALVRREAGALA